MSIMPMHQPLFYHLPLLSWQPPSFLAFLSPRVKVIDVIVQVPYNKIILIMQKQQNSSKLEEDRIIDDGFSSEEEVQHQEIIVEQVKQEVQQSTHKEQVKFKIPPPPQIKDKSYSLRPDIEMGWQSKLNLPVPVPMIFESERFDHLVRKMLKQPKQKAKLCYLGPRYQNTYYAWYDKPFRFPYDHIKAPNDMKFTNRPFCGQHWEAEDDLLFDSFFEGGNLDCVIRVGEREYDCFMRVDSNTTGHLQWFNFKVKGWKKLLKYKINICNFQRDKCLFARGMKPYFYSQKRFRKQKIAWQQDGENVRFQRKHLTASKVYDFELRHMFRLSFQYYTQYEDDQIQIAYCIPYTYTKLSEFLLHLSNKPETKSFLKVSKLCNSLGGLQVPLVLIHQGLEEEASELSDQYGISKRCIVISGRAHPGESNGSHMMEGFIEWLCGNSKQAYIMRKYIVFKIVPMLNPDGVAIGNYRTGLSGKDFNRQYRNPDKTLFPQVFHFKKLVAQNKCLFGQKLLMFLDFHGHSTKKNTFVYGPQFPIVDRFYYQARLFPKLLGNVTPMFRYYSCIFKINSFKETTARAIILRKIGVPLSYTIQTSNGSFFDYEQLCDVPYTQQLWKNMGNSVAEALFEYVDLVLTADRNRYEKMQSKKKQKGNNKKGHPKSSKRSPQKVERVSIFSTMENQKIKHLFQEIKKAEADKQMHKVSDDQLSQGSSDEQGQQNDLSAAQTSYLTDIIKGGKYKSVSRCKMRNKAKMEQHRTTQDAAVCKVQNQPIVEQEHVQGQQQQGSQSQQLLNKKKAINIRKPISSKQRINLSLLESEDKKVTAKIINFSFVNQSPRNRSKDSTDKRFNLPNKLNFIELVTGKWSQERVRERKESLAKNKVVVDLSDPHFRKTFTYNLKERREEGERIHQAQGHYIPQKRGRFDHFKYRRLLLSNNQSQNQDK